MPRLNGLSVTLQSNANTIPANRSKENLKRDWRDVIADGAGPLAKRLGMPVGLMLVLGE